MDAYDILAKYLKDVQSCCKRKLITFTSDNKVKTIIDVAHANSSRSVTYFVGLHIDINDTFQADLIR